MTHTHPNKIFNGKLFSLDSSGFYIDKQGKLLQDYVWECQRGQIPDGYVVAYRSSDRYDVRLSNLELMQVSTQSDLDNHSDSSTHHDLSVSDRLKAVEWHKSEEGRKVHSKNTKILHNRKTFEHKLICDCCGKKYKGKIYSKTSNHFCSSNCRVKYFRQHKKEIANEI